MAQEPIITLTHRLIFHGFNHTFTKELANKFMATITLLGYFETSPLRDYDPEHEIF